MKREPRQEEEDKVCHKADAGQTLKSKFSFERPQAQTAGRALEKEMSTHSSVFAWRIPGTEEPGRRLSMGSHRVGHD